MYIDSFMRSYLDQCEKTAAEIEEKMAALPAETLQISTSGKYYTWRVRLPDGQRKYLPRQSEEVAIKLAQKKAYAAQLHDLQMLVQACRRFINCRTRSTEEFPKLITDSGPEFKRLLGEDLRTHDENILAWENEPYKKYDGYPENLKIPTLKQGEYVRSKTEAIMAGLLFTMNLPYKYEKVTQIGDRKFAVDFTVLDTRTFKEIPIEIFGMMDDPEYAKLHNKKMNAYIAAGYLPGVNFLTFYDLPKSPLGQIYIEQTLENFFINNPPIII